jgi:DNA-binding transcriptional MocR family regulator
MPGLCHKWIMVNRATSAKLALSFAGQLGEWTVGRGPLYRRLARAIAGAIETGALTPGSQLPAERVSAATLAVSRGTAVAAYDVLVADGLIERRRGSGTFVVGTAVTGVTGVTGATGVTGLTSVPGVTGGTGFTRYPADRDGSPLVHRLVDRSVDTGAIIDLSLSVLADANGLPVVRVTARDLRAVSPPSGLSPWGLPSLRAVLADHLNGWGLPSTPEEVVVTAGAQQAVSLAAACWVRPGDRVVVDEPTYPGAIAAFRQAGARLVGVPVDGDGPRPDALAAALATRPVLVYLQSGVHSPTGSVMSRRRTEELAARIRGARVPFVEDRALADLAWKPVPPPIGSLLPSTSTVVVGSLSKLFWGGLRIGFVRAAGPLALRFARIKATRDLGTSAVSQVLAERLMSDAASVTARRRTELRSRARILGMALADAVPGATWTPPSGGMSLWLRLPAPAAARLSVAARRHGVVIATPDSLTVRGGYDDRIRVSFGGPPLELREAATRLGAAWDSLGPYPGGGQRRSRG